MAAKGKKGHGPHRRGGHEEEHEEHVNHERWLVTYADMLTLLMVLFIVLFAISQVNQKKFNELKTGLSSGFGQPVEMLSGSSGLLNSGTTLAPDMVTLIGQAAGQANQGTTGSTSTTTTKEVADLVKQLEAAATKGEADKLAKLEKKLKKALSKNGVSNQVRFGYSPEGLVLTIATDKVLYPSGSATLQTKGARLLDVLCSTLRSSGRDLSIIGHTDDNPIHTAAFPSNWELSTARATGVLRRLHGDCRIAYSRLRAVGYADTKPLVTPASTAAARARNRRVEIVVLAELDGSQGTALQNQAQAASGDTATEGLLASDGQSVDSTDLASTDTSSAGATETSGGTTTGTTAGSGTTTDTGTSTASGTANSSTSSAAADGTGDQSTTSGSSSHG